MSPMPRRPRHSDRLMTSSTWLPISVCSTTPAADGADWKEVARTVLHIDVARKTGSRARRAWETHLARARWITEHGYRDLLRGGHRN